jgi:hypothetical protein
MAKPAAMFPSGRRNNIFAALTSQNPAIDIMKKYYLFLSILLLLSAATHSQNLVKDFPEISGYIGQAYVDKDADKLYVTGQLKKVGYLANGYAVVDSNGKLTQNWPKAIGSIDAADSDGDGGWYLGGAFTMSGNESIRNFAHVLKDGSLDSDFWKVDAEVNFIKKINNKLYVGGTFSYIEKKDLFQYNAVCSFNGAFNQYNFRMDRAVYRAVADGKGGLYIFGGFTYVGDSIRQGLAHIDNKGQVTAWHPKIQSDYITKVVVSDGLVYMIGSFNYVNNTPSYGVVAVDTALGQISWNPYVNGEVKDLVVTDDAIYIAGSMNIAGSKARHNIASFDKTTGLVTDWAPNINSIVFDMVVWQDQLLVTGDFTKVDQTNVDHFTSFNLSTGLQGNLAVHIYGGNAYKMEVRENLLYVSGNFSMINSSYRKYLACVDLVEQKVTPWNPEPDNNQLNWEIVNGHFLVTGTNKFGEIQFLGLTEVNLKTGKAVAFSKDFQLLSVSCIAQYGKSLFLGSLGWMGGAECKNFVEIDLATKRLTSWRPFLKWVNNIIPYKNLWLITASEYRDSLYQNLTHGLIIMDTATRVTQNWNLPASSDEIIKTILNGDDLIIATRTSGIKIINLVSKTSTNFHSQIDIRQLSAIEIVGNQLFLAGYLADNPSSSTGYNLAAVDIHTGGLIQKYATKYSVNILRYDQHSRLYIGGDISVDGSPDQYGAIAMNVKNGTILNWFPLFSSDGPKDIYPTSRGEVLLYGITQVGGELVKPVIEIDLKTKKLSAWRPVFPPNTYAGAITTNQDYIIYTTSKVYPPYKLIIIDKNTYQEVPVNITFNNYVNKVTVINNTLYCIGSFDSVNNEPRKFIAAIDLTTKEVLPWQVTFNKNSNLLDIIMFNNKLYLCGGFDTINGVTRNGIAEVDPLTAEVSPWSLNFLAYGRSFKEVDGLLYFYGYFEKKNSGIRNYYACLNPDGTLNNWECNLNAVPKPAFEDIDDNTFIVTNDVSTERLEYEPISLINISQKKKDIWIPLPKSSTYPLHCVKSAHYMIIYGMFSLIENSVVNNIAAFDLNPKVTTSDPVPVLVREVSSEKRNTLTLFPNPSNGVVKIDTENKGDILSVLIFDQYGKNVLAIDRVTSEVDLSALGNGIYYLNILFKNGDRTYRKMDIQH